MSKPSINVQNKCDSNTSPQEYRMSGTEIERLQSENVNLRAEIETLKRIVLDLSLRVTKLESMSSTKFKIGSIERNVKDSKKRKRKSFGSSYLILPRHMKKFVKITARSVKLKKTELNAVEVQHVEDVVNELNKESAKDIEVVLKAITEEAQVQKEDEKENIKVYTREKLNSDEV
ncbi:hypothetical protein AXF42_Ash002096 [Apostasia shenzhenica]|uniref:Uncharacterized protein n=1 Tax=Apostasia shenzhenica TaxID=1088818 RepID=A0A2I0AML8_9ASPA|nr:hypothetical protein AXF42_Ash002096 [Apostasia shenzhenica]